MSERFGKYQLLKRLASGGMAEIWLGRQVGVEGFEKLVVLKRILPQLAQDQRFVSMFLDEARLAARFSHANVVQIFDLGQADGTYFIAMELVAGENLAALARAARRAGRPVPVTYAARIISLAAQGLHYAHTRTDGEGRPLGVIHRDVSPQNILVSFDGQVKVVDFGIAKARSQVEQTEAGVLKGKYAYMSPEQGRGQDLDARSDLFSLGIVLWELVAGARLFKRPSGLATLDAITRQPLPAIRSRRPDVPLALEGILDKALQRDPEARFQTGDELHRALERFIHTTGAPVTSGDLAAYAGELLPDARARWRRLLEARERGEDLGSQVLAGLGQAGTPASNPGSDGGDATRSERREGSRSGLSGLRELDLADFGDAGPALELALDAPPTASPEAAPEADPEPDADAATGSGAEPAPRTGSPPPAPRRRRGGFGRWALIAGGAVLAGVLVFAITGRVLASRPRGKGTLVVRGQPARSEVLVDDTRRATGLPAELADVSVGVRHRVTVLAPGHLPWSTVVTLAHAGARVTLDASPLPRGRHLQPAEVKVVSKPPGAVAIVDGLRLPGRTPMTVELTTGHPGSLVRLSKPGFADRTWRVDLSPGRHVQVGGPLKPAHHLWPW